MNDLLKYYPEHAPFAVVDTETGMVIMQFASKGAAIAFVGNRRSVTKRHYKLIEAVLVLDTENALGAKHTKTEA